MKQYGVAIVFGIFALFGSVCSAEPETSVAHVNGAGKLSATAPVYTTAVMNFSSAQSDLEESAEKVNSLLPALLSASGSLILVERAELDKIISEQELSLSGTVDQHTAATIGRLTGAKVLVSGKLFSIDNKVYLVSKIMGTETGRVFGETESFLRQGSLAEAIERMATKIVAAVSSRQGEMVAPVESLDDLVAKLKATLQGDVLPRVALKITERTVARATVASSSETEMAAVLSQVGFEIVDMNLTSVKPDIVIEGGSFSEFGLRRGNLVSSKGRVEVKAIDQASERFSP